MSKALLFDLDGTLLMSDPLHYAVFAEMFAARGRVLTPAIYASDIHGTHNLDSFPKLFPGEDAQGLSDAKEAMFRDRLGDGAAPMPGLVALLDLAATRGWATAVVTNAPRPNALHMLDAIGLRARFDPVVIGDECTRAKPDPEPYLVAMRALGLRPQDCIAFEDSESGMAAAAASGAHAVGIRSGLDDARLRAAGAAITIQDFNDDALPDVLARLAGETTQ
ncbi:HAD family hydrolase [Salipiger sp.]|uniref:HAD family hydrolase n=1 Tax=Salipiger sp. TaxID=2078585 RepID=UPI003A968BF3